MYQIPLGRNARYGTLAVDDAKFTDAVREHIFVYGLRQVLNDAIAQKTDDGAPIPDDQLIAKAQARLDAFYRGEVRTRTAAESGDPVEAELHRLAKDTIAALYRKLGEMKDFPKGTKNRLLFAANRRRAARHQPEFADDVEMVRTFLESSPQASALRKQAERTVRERDAVDVDALGI